MSQISLADLIKNRRTRKPITYTSSVPTSLVTKLIDTARYAPNHHRTEPARFYLLNREKILQLAKLFGETIRGDKQESSLIEKAKKKEREWSHATGLLVITSYSDHDSILVRKNPRSLRKILPRLAVSSKIFFYFLKILKLQQNGALLESGSTQNLLVL